MYVSKGSLYFRFNLTQEVHPVGYDERHDNPALSDELCRKDAEGAKVTCQ